MSDHLLIQDRWKPKIGDVYHYYSCGCDNFEVVCLHMIWDKKVILKRIMGEKWLPRQDQLQGMIDDTEDRKLSRIEKWTNQTYIDHWKPWGMFKTFEQLWLVFVMNELYQLKWNGNNWT